LIVAEKEGEGASPSKPYQELIQGFELINQHTPERWQRSYLGSQRRSSENARASRAKAVAAKIEQAKLVVDMDVVESLKSELAAIREKLSF